MKRIINLPLKKPLLIFALFFIAFCLTANSGYGAGKVFGTNTPGSAGQNENAPVPDIKANGQDGPLSISTADTLSVAVTLNASGLTSPADWWAVVQKPDGNWEYFDISAKTFQSGLIVTYQGPLFDLGSYQILNSSGLAQGTYTYYFGVDMTVDGAVTMSDVVYNSVVVNVSAGTTGATVTDVDGNVYNTVTIGSQVWMQENLKTTNYSNGDAIGTTTPATLDISSMTSPKYQWAYDGDQSNVSTYGLLYTWYAATDSRGLCPSGWHLPSDTERTTLENYLGGASVAGGKMKATSLWIRPNTGATNSSGFTGLPGGVNGGNGQFGNIGDGGYWWSSTTHASNTLYAWMRTLQFSSALTVRTNYFKYIGLSVRCVKD